MSLKRTRSQGHLDKFTGNLNKYIDEKSENRIERVLGKQYSGCVRLYKFPIEKCKEIKAYKVLEENKSEETKQILKEMKDKKESAFEHLVSTFGMLPEKDIDFNALAIISHKLAEKFARDSGDFEVGPLKDTELVEFHTYATTHSKRHLGLLKKHIDDEGAVSYNTITLIWYLIKDKDVEGGNISFFAPDLPANPTPAQLSAYYESKKENEVTINLWDQIDDVREKCVCLIFKGDIVHSPESMGGRGERSAIVFQFMRIDKPAAAKIGGKRKNMPLKTLKRCSRREAYAKSKSGKRRLSRCDKPIKSRAEAEH